MLSFSIQPPAKGFISQQKEWQCDHILGIRGCMACWKLKITIKLTKSQPTFIWSPCAGKPEHQWSVLHRVVVPLIPPVLYWVLIKIVFKFPNYSLQKTSDHSLGQGFWKSFFCRVSLPSWNSPTVVYILKWKTLTSGPEHCTCEGINQGASIMCWNGSRHFELDSDHYIRERTTQA